MNLNIYTYLNFYLVEGIFDLLLQLLLLLKSPLSEIKKTMKTTKKKHLGREKKRLPYHFKYNKIK